MEIEKGPVNLFPVEPTDEDLYVEETLNLGFKGLLGMKKKRPRRFRLSLSFSCRRWDLNPHEVALVRF